MSVLKKATLIILTALSTACGTKQAVDSPNGENVRFSLEDSNNITNEIETSFFQPEETDESLIGTISILCQYKDFIYIADSRYDKLYKFDRNGKFLSKIGRKGQGAGEYLGARYIFINEGAGLVGVLDEDAKKVLYYGINDNEFKKSESFPDITSNCCVPFDDGLLWFNLKYDESSLRDKYFVETDSEGKITNGFVTKEFFSGYNTGSSCHLFSLDGKTYGFTPYDLKLYEFKDHDVNVKYDIDVVGFQPPTTAFLNEVSDGGQSPSLFSGLFDSDYISHFGVTMCPSLMAIAIIRNHERYIGLMDRRTGRTSFQTQTDFSKAVGLGGSYYQLHNTIDDCILFDIDKNSVEDYISETGNEVDPRLLKLVESDNSNPIVMMMKMKN